MKCEALISDWNGTIIAYRNETPVLEGVAKDALRASVPFHPWRVRRILKARAQSQALRRKGHSETDIDFVKEMFGIFNKMVASGLPTEVVRRSFDKYANRSETQSKLDLRVLKVIREVHEAGKTTGILSAGYRYGIEKALTVAGYRQCFDFCEADEFREKDGRVTEFGLSIYGNKPRLLLKLLAERHLEASRVAYIGDSEDDEGCFEIVGVPLVAFLASSDFKDKCARKYKAFVPDSEKELAGYLLNP